MFEIEWKNPSKTSKWGWNEIVVFIQCYEGEEKWPYPPLPPSILMYARLVHSFHDEQIYVNFLFLSIKIFRQVLDLIGIYWLEKGLHVPK